MQQRMATHMLSPVEVQVLLKTSKVGRIATHGTNAYPYIVPVHFVHHDSKIYVHGLIQGRKLDDIAANPRVAFEVDEMQRILCDGVAAPCDVNTEYQSVVLLGNARLLHDAGKKREVLGLIVEKYTPYLSGVELTDNAVAATAVIEIDVLECTGKYFR